MLYHQRQLTRFNFLCFNRRCHAANDECCSTKRGSFSWPVIIIKIHATLYGHHKTQKANEKGSCRERKRVHTNYNGRQPTNRH